MICKIFELTVQVQPLESCLKRMGLLRGDKITMRFKRLNMECTRTKTEAAITITRPKDE